MALKPNPIQNETQAIVNPSGSQQLNQNARQLTLWNEDGTPWNPEAGTVELPENVATTEYVDQAIAALRDELTSEG